MSIDSIHAPELSPEGSTPTQRLIEGLRKQLHYMPFLGAQGAPYFDGKQATNFLQRYELLFCEFEENEAIAVKRLPLYCSDQVGAAVEYLAGYETGNWAEIKVEILEEYRAYDTKQHMYRVRFLEELTSAQKDRTGDIRQFVHIFTAVSTRLRETGILSEYQEVQLFLGGLDLNLVRKLGTKFKLDVNAPESVQGKFDLIRQEALNYRLGAVHKAELIQRGASEFLSEGLVQQILARPVPEQALASRLRAQQQPQTLTAQCWTRDPDLTLAIDEISKRIEAIVMRQQTQFLVELRRVSQQQPQVYAAPGIQG
jgi:hypothetical protein